MKLRPAPTREQVTAGKRDRVLTIQRSTRVQDVGSGEWIDTWGTLATVWTSKKDTSDGERMRAAELSAEISTRFVIEWSAALAGVTVEDRVECEGRVYNIYSVKEIGTREGIEITGTARADQ